MGGLYGINRFRPDDIKYNKKRPSVMFTRLFLFNEEVGVGEEYEGRVILDKALNNKQNNQTEQQAKQRTEQQ